MLTIKKTDISPVVDAYIQKHIPNYTVTTDQFMGIFCDDELLGLGSIILEKGKVYMNLLHECLGDSMLLHGLAKSLLNMADLKGIKTVYGSNTELSSMYERLRFVKEDNEFILSLEGYFTAE